MRKNLAKGTKVTATVENREMRATVVKSFRDGKLGQWNIPLVVVILDQTGKEIEVTVQSLTFNLQRPR